MATFASLIALSAIGFLLWIVLLAVRPVTQKIFSQTWHYYVGLIPVFFLLGGSTIIIFAMRFVSSVLVRSDVNLGAEAITDSNLPEAAAQTIGGNAAVLNTLRNELVDKINIEAIIPYALLIWAMGMLIFFALKIKSYYKFKRGVFGSIIEFETAQSPVKVVKSSYVTMPMLIGIWKPVIVLPDLELSEKEADVILSHELVHLKRRDLLIKLIILITNGVHWFNPAAYLLNKDMDNLCESSCDERLVCEMDKTERKFYGETILRILERGVMQRAGLYTNLCGSKRNIKRRLSNMMNFNKMRRSVIGLSLVAAVAVAEFGGTMAFAASNIVTAANPGAAASWYEPYKSFIAAEKIYVNGELVKDFPAFYTRTVQIGGIFEENIYVPLRAIAEKLGLVVTWDKKAKAATVGGIEIKQAALPDGYKGLSPMMIGNYLYVSPSLFTDLLNKEVNLIYEKIVTEMFGTDLALYSSTTATDGSEQLTDSPMENNNNQGSGASAEDERLTMVLATNIEKGLLNFESVDKAVVTLTIGSNDSFFIGNSPATAFVVLTINKNIEKEQATAIVNYILKSVNGLNAENIKIVDQNDNIIFSGVSE